LEFIVVSWMQRGLISMLRAVALAASLVALAGCPGPGGDPADAALDGGPDDDGGSGGLWFVFATKEPLPTAVSGNVTVEEITLELRDVRAIGEAVPTGDPRTWRAAFTIELDDEGTPSELSFMDAPPGLYSHLLAELDAQDAEVSFRISGTIDGLELLDGGLEEVEVAIEGSASIPLAIVLKDADLAAGTTLVLTLTMDVSKAVDSVDWTGVALEDGRLVIDEEHSPAELAKVTAFFQDQPFEQTAREVRSGAGSSRTAPRRSTAGTSGPR
jgi:hypothetical protein